MNEDEDAAAQMVPVEMEASRTPLQDADMGFDDATSRLWKDARRKMEASEGVLEAVRRGIESARKEAKKARKDAELVLYLNDVCTTPNL